jgi:hypothetical protein
MDTPSAAQPVERGLARPLAQAAAFVSFTLEEMIRKKSRLDYRQHDSE